MLVMVTGTSVIGFRGRQGFWPWDLRRRKIERWRWLVESPPNSDT
jgi:hypothetical protein